MTYDVITSRVGFGHWVSRIYFTGTYAIPTMSLDAIFEGDTHEDLQEITTEVDCVVGFTRWGTSRKGIRRMLRIVNNEYKREQSRVRMRYERRDSGNINAERRRVRKLQR